jgi:predicted secreted hydrolase
MTVAHDRASQPNAFIFFSMIGAKNFHFYEKIPCDQFVASDQQCDVQAAGSCFKSDCEGNYTIHMESRGKKKAVDLFIRNITRGFTVTMPDAFWAVAAPLAKVHGTIFSDGKTSTVEGHGYHDHNWGVSKESDVAWNWGSVAHPEKRVSVTFGKMIIPGKIHQDLVIVSDEKSFQHSLDGQAEIQYLQTAFHGHRYPCRERILAQTEQMKVDIVVALERGHHADDIDIFLSKYQGRVMIEGESLEVDGQGWWEYKYESPPFLGRFINRLGARYAYLRDHLKNG